MAQPYDPYPFLPSGEAITGAGASIYDYLRRKAAPLLEGPQYQPQFQSPYISSVAPPQMPAPAPTPAPSLVPPPVAAPMAPPPQAAPAQAPQLQAHDTPPDTPLNSADFGRTKTDGWWAGQRPGSSLPYDRNPPAPEPPPMMKFAYAGQPLQDYNPSKGIADFAGAPATDTFMGRQTTPGRGTLSVMNESQNKDESQLLQDAERAMIENRIANAERSKVDPLWYERELGAIDAQNEQRRADLWRRSQVGAGEDIRNVAESQLRSHYEEAARALKNSPDYNTLRPESQRNGRTLQDQQQADDEALRQKFNDDWLKIMSGIRTSTAGMPGQVLSTPNRRY